VNTVQAALAEFQRRAEERRQLEASRLEIGALSPEEAERYRLEAEEPGITQVNWGPDGAIHLDDD
jgi:hypothetical protein